MNRKLRPKVLLIFFSIFLIIGTQWAYFKYRNLRIYTEGLENEGNLLKFQNKEFESSILTLIKVSSLTFDTISVKSDVNGKDGSLHSLVGRNRSISRIVFVPHSICIDCFSKEFVSLKDFFAKMDDSKIVFQGINMNDYRSKCEQSKLGYDAYFSKIKPVEVSLNNVFLLQIDSSRSISRIGVLVSKSPEYNKRVIELFF